MLSSGQRLHLPLPIRAFYLNGRTWPAHLYDYVEFARTMCRFAADAQKAMQEKSMNLSIAPLRDALSRMESAAVSFSAAGDEALRTGFNTATAKRVNATLLGVERALTRAQGLATRSWFRNLIYASDENADIPQWFFRP